MIIVVASIIAVATVPLCGRSLAPLASLALRRVWLVWLSISLQLVITLVPSFPAALGEPVHLFTFAASAAFLWSNRHIAGVVAISVGAALNLSAIAANGGTMPASAWAWRTAGFPTPSDGFENSSIVHSARLPWLGDIFAIPHGWPLANVFSIGDLVIVVGVGYLAHRAGRAMIVSEHDAQPAPASLAPSR